MVRGECYNRCRGVLHWCEILGKGSWVRVIQSVTRFQGSFLEEKFAYSRQALKNGRMWEGLCVRCKVDGRDCGGQCLSASKWWLWIERSGNWLKLCGFTLVVWKTEGSSICWKAGSITRSAISIEFTGTYHVILVHVASVLLGTSPNPTGLVHGLDWSVKREARELESGRNTAQLCGADGLQWWSQQLSIRELVRGWFGMVQFWMSMVVWYHIRMLTYRRLFSEHR